MAAAVLPRRLEFIVLALGVVLIFPAQVRGDEPASRGLYVSVVQDPPVLTSRAEIIKLIYFARQAEIKTLYVQIYRANQAWFPSRVADDTPYKKSLQAVSEDPFALLIKQARRHGIQVFVWLNLLSLAENKEAPFIKKYGTDVLTTNLKNKSKLADYKIDDQFFLEPGDPRVRADLAQMLKEILQAYPELDGIQFDYIRYPDVNPHYGYTKINMERFKQAAGLETIDEKSPAWHDWRRKQVTELLAGLVKIARALRPDIIVSATGCMPYPRAYYEAYQDWPAWLAEGLVDSVTIMAYSPDPAEFERWLAAAKKKTAHFSKVQIGVGAYKLTAAPEKFEREFEYCETLGTTCVVFHYGSLQENPALKLFLKRSGKH